MRIILTGATGTAGSAALAECLADARVGHVTALGRRPPGLAHPKLKSLVHHDFMDYGAVRSELAGHDACLWCLGIAQSEVTQEEYERITYQYTIAALDAFVADNPSLTFCFLSGNGADSKERSRILFARTKGRTENELLRRRPGRTYCFRPAFIHPLEPRPKRKLSERIPDVLAPLLYKLAPGMIISAPDLGKAMIRVAKYGAKKPILENNDIRALAAEPIS